jgi:hypothetical protein
LDALTDPRRREVTYPLINIGVIAVCAVICGADDFVAIAEFGRKERQSLARFLDLRNGIPSHDRFNAILAAIKPMEFEKCLLRRTRSRRGTLLLDLSCSGGPAGSRSLG